MVVVCIMGARIESVVEIHCWICRLVVRSEGVQGKGVVFTTSKFRSSGVWG